MYSLPLTPDCSERVAPASALHSSVEPVLLASAVEQLLALGRVARAGNRSPGGHLLGAVGGRPRTASRRRRRSPPAGPCRLCRGWARCPRPAAAPRPAPAARACTPSRAPARTCSTTTRLHLAAFL